MLEFWELYRTLLRCKSEWWPGFDAMPGLWVNRLGTQRPFGIQKKHQHARLICIQCAGHLALMVCEAGGADSTHRPLSSPLATRSSGQWPQWLRVTLTFCLDPQSCPDQGKQGGIEHDRPIAVQRHVHGNQALEGDGAKTGDHSR